MQLTHPARRGLLRVRDFLAIIIADHHIREGPFLEMIDAHLSPSQVLRLGNEGALCVGLARRLSARITRILLNLRIRDGVVGIKLAVHNVVSHRLDRQIRGSCGYRHPHSRPRCSHGQRHSNHAACDAYVTL